MRIIITLFILFVTIATAFAEQSYQVKFYRKNGLEPLRYSIYDINKIDIKNVSNKYIIKIHHQDTNTAYYPVVSIDSIKFETDTNQVKYFTPYLFGTKFPYSIAEIDSVIFEEIETIINEDAIVVDTNQLKKILYLDSTLMIVDKSAKFTNGLAVGDIIVGEPSGNTPDGFLRKVISIITVGDSIEIETEQAELTDVIQSGVISFSATFTPQDTAQQKYRQGRDRTMAEEGFSFVYKDLVIYDRDGDLSTKDQIKLDGSITFAPNLDFNLVIVDWDVKQILFQGTMRSQLSAKSYANLEHETTLHKSLNELLGIPKIHLPPIVIPVGICPICIPISITPNIEVNTGVTLKFTAEVSAKVSTEFTTVFGFEYNSGNWRIIGSFDGSFDFTPPELSVGGSLKPYIGPQINMNFFNYQDALNTYINAHGFLELEVDFLKNPMWQLWGGVEASAGVSSDKIEALNKKLPLVLEIRELLVQAHDLISSLSPYDAKVGDTLTIKGEGFGNTRGSSYIKFKFGESLLPIDCIEATDYISWGDKEIKLKVPNGLNPGKVDLLVNVGGFYSNKAEVNIEAPHKINSISPSSVKIGKEMTISGYGFGTTRDTSFVSFNDIKATDYTIWNDSTIKVKVPEDAIDGKVSVNVNGIKSNEKDYTIDDDSTETVTIGDQEWMLKNLDVSTFKNGDPIRHAKSPEEWEDAINKEEAVWCYYNNDPELGAIYGKLYNWYAVIDQRGLAPEGFRIPSKDDWDSLTEFLKSDSIYRCENNYSFIAKSLAAKERWIIWENYCNIGNDLSANNRSGFTAFPGGVSSWGYFDLMGDMARWWSTTLFIDRVWTFGLSTYYPHDLSGSFFNYKNLGYSVRCLKD